MDITIPKKLYSESQNRYIKFSEIFLIKLFYLVLEF